MSTTIPAAPPAVRMRWDNLLFLHWPVAPDALRKIIPEPLEIDTFDGHAWVALVPFRMESTRFRGFPSLPGLDSFYECNVRTYVTAREGDQIIRGVWFMSLDAERLIPVLGGRWLWNLNYIHSRFEVSAEGNTTDYRLARRSDPTKHSRMIWERGDPLPQSQPGSIEHFLTERYTLFTVRAGRLMQGPIDHKPWSLRSARLIDLEDTLVRAGGVEVTGAPLCWHSDTLEVVGWNLQRVRTDD